VQGHPSRALQTNRQQGLDKGPSKSASYRVYQTSSGLFAFASHWLAKMKAKRSLPRRSPVAREVYTWACRS